MALSLSTSTAIGAGAAAYYLAGPARRQVRTATAIVTAGPHYRASQQAAKTLQTLASSLNTAGERLQRGLIKPTEYEAIWWQAYDGVAAVDRITPRDDLFTRQPR